MSVQDCSRASEIVEICLLSGSFVNVRKAMVDDMRVRCVADVEVLDHLETPTTGNASSSDKKQLRVKSAEHRRQTCIEEYFTKSSETSTSNAKASLMHGNVRRSDKKQLRNKARGLRRQTCIKEYFRKSSKISTFIASRYRSGKKVDILVYTSKPLSPFGNR